jgi:branched-chain amino acid transport system permease protein
MELFVQQIVNGVGTGAIYALFGLGLGLLFSTVGVLNVAFGALASASALVAWKIAEGVVLPFPLLVAAACLAGSAISVLIDQVVLRPLRRRTTDLFPSMLATIGAWLILLQVMRNVTGGQAVGFPSGSSPTTVWHIAGIRLSAMQLLDVGAVVVAASAAAIFLRRSHWGLAIRAVGWKAESAQIVGVNKQAVFVLVAAISGALIGLSGVLTAMTTGTLNAEFGDGLMFYGFAALIVGGLSDLRGTVLAGIVLGVAQVLTAEYWSGQVQDAVTFGLLLLFLLVRPEGLFRPQATKV